MRRLSAFGDDCFLVFCAVHGAAVALHVTAYVRTLRAWSWGLGHMKGYLWSRFCIPSCAPAIEGHLHCGQLGLSGSELECQRHGFRSLFEEKLFFILLKISG